MLPSAGQPLTLLLYLSAGYWNELEHGQFNRMTTGQQVGTAAAGLAVGGILYEVRGGTFARHCLCSPTSL